MNSLTDIKIIECNRQASNEGDLINPEVPFDHPEMTLPVTQDASTLVQRHNQASLQLFDNLLESGVCREQARGVLPQNMYTEYYGTVNLRCDEQRCS